MTIRKEGKQKRKIRRKELRRVPLILGRVVEKKVFSLPFPSVLEAISSFSSILERAEVNSDRATGKLRYTWARITEGKEKRNFIGFSTRPREISDGLEKGLSFLGAIHFPLHETATIISLSFRFIPILTEEAGRIMDAQKSRGAKIGEGNIIEKAKSVMPLIIPLFISAFRRSDELALAMDSRLYGSGKRSVWKKLEYGVYDKYGYIFAILLLILTIVDRCFL